MSDSVRAAGEHVAIVAAVPGTGGSVVVAHLEGERPAVRELVYLSDRKLAQFLPTLRSLWPRPRINLRSPLVEVGFEPGADGERDRLRHLARVIAHIEKTARWFLDPDIAPGQWVQFEAPLNYFVVNGRPDPVFFVDRDTATKDYPTGGANRLILHCSSTHLRANKDPVTVTTPPENDAWIAYGGSDPGAMRADSVQLLLDDLAPQGPSADEPLPQEGSRQLPAAVSRLLRAIDTRVHPETAAWMAGYARVTADVSTQADQSVEPVRHVIASPLYIEYTTSLS